MTETTESTENVLNDNKMRKKQNRNTVMQNTKSQKQKVMEKLETRDKKKIRRKKITITETKKD